jgi:hypothetical protein
VKGIWSIAAVCVSLTVAGVAPAAQRNFLIHKAFPGKKEIEQEAIKRGLTPTMRRLGLGLHHLRVEGGDEGVVQFERELLKAWRAQNDVHPRFDYADAVETTPGTWELGYR